MYRMNGAELTITLLQRQGITTIAGIPGGSNLPLYDALSRNGKIRHVLTRHEQGAGFIGQGLARVTGKTAVCFATSGPGATNVLTAVADAKLDSIPLICITGQVPGPMIGTDAFQEVDTYGMSIPITKHNFLVRSVDELTRIIPAAFRIAMADRPGPVLIDIPKDIQLQELAVDELPAPGLADPPAPPKPDDLTAAARMIEAAKRPVLYLGGGVIQAGGAGAARRLAEKCNLPVTMSLLGLGAVPAGHPLALSMLGMHAARYTNMILEECDLLIGVGTRFDDRATGKLAEFCPDAGVIHIDIDHSELNKLKNSHVGLVADARQTLEALLERVAPKPRSEWLARVAQLKAEFPIVMPGADNPRAPYGMIRTVARLAGPDALVATDVGKHQMWVAQSYPFVKPRQLLTSGGLGTMGFGLPAAIGAALARPDCKVVCFSGDGSLLMNIQELATAVEQNVDITVIVLDNRSLGLVRQQQDLFFGKRYFASEYGHTVDYQTIARGFGMKSFDLAAGHDPEATLAAALDHAGPCLVHAPVAINEGAYPMVPPGGANREMIGGEYHADAAA